MDQDLSEVFDAIIIGSGPGGATVARELSKRKKRVLILERGGNAPLKEGLFAAAAIVSSVSVGNKLATARALTTGGTTAVYFGVADEPPLEIFRSLGIELSGELAEAQRELPLAVLRDELLGPRAVKVRESALALGYPWKKNTMLVDLSRCASGYTYESKWTARDYVREAIDDGAVLVNHARVLKVLIENGRAIGVEYKLQRGKKDFDVRRAFGSKIVLAAGGAASPVILRESGVKNVADGGFYCHPGFGVFALVPALKGGDNFGATMGGSPEDDLNVGDANFGRVAFRMFMLGSRRFFRAFLHSRTIGVGVMVKEGLGGELQENNRYHKDLNEADRDKLTRGEAIARRILQHAGGKHLIKTSLSAAQIGGAIRIKEHVDENLQTEYSDLYVCDGSVIPETVKVSPTLTLICLGKYLANHLAQAL